MDKPISRQRRWQLRMMQQGRCSLCGKPAVNAKYCKRHRKAVNASRRKVRV